MGLSKITILDRSLEDALNLAGMEFEIAEINDTDKPEIWLSEFVTQQPKVLAINAANTNPLMKSILQSCSPLIAAGAKLAVLGVLEWRVLEDKKRPTLAGTCPTAFDDFLLLPTLPVEAKLRIKRLLHKAANRLPNRTKKLTYGPLMFESETQRITANGEPLSLTRRETELLLFLCKQPFSIITREQIAQHVWKITAATDSFQSVLNGHLSRLRHKLSEAGCPNILKAIHRQGILINLNPTPAAIRSV